MADKKQIDVALEGEGDDRPSETFLAAVQRDAEIVQRNRIQVRRAIDRSSLKRTKTKKDPTD